MAVMSNEAVRAARSPQLRVKVNLWEQVADVLEGEFSAAQKGSRTSSEAEYCARFGVSRVTVRQALASLQDKGLIESRAGRGWFIVDQESVRVARMRVPTISEPPGKLMSFTNMARSRGSVPDSVVLEQRVHPANLDEAEAFMIMPGAEVLTLRRLRRLDGVPVAIDQSMVPLYLLPEAMGIDFTQTSLHAALGAVDAMPTIAETEVEAVLANANRASLLDVNEGFPLLKIRQAFFDAHGRATERGEIVYRGDRYRYRSRPQA